MSSGENVKPMPVGWDSSEPLDSRILHRRTRIEPSNNRLIDQRGAALIESVNEPLLLSNQLVELNYVRVKKLNDTALVSGRWHTYSNVADI